MCFSMPATPSKHVRVSLRKVDDVSRLSDPACMQRHILSAVCLQATPRYQPNWDGPPASAALIAIDASASRVVSRRNAC